MMFRHSRSFVWTDDVYIWCVPSMYINHHSTHSCMHTFWCAFHMLRPRLVIFRDFLHLRRNYWRSA